MALIAAPHFVPEVPVPRNAFPSFNDQLIDASGEKVALLLRAPKTGTLKRPEFLLDAVTQAPANGLRVSFQSLDASGNPNGTQAQFRDVTSGITAGAWITPGILTDDGTDTGAKRSVTAGDLFAVVIEFVSFQAGDSLEVRSLSPTAVLGINTQIQHFTTSWAKISAGPIVALQYDDDSYPYLCGARPISALNIALNIHTGTTPDEAAMRFASPVEREIGGFALHLNTNNVARDFDVILYDAGGSVLFTRSYDADALAPSQGLLSDLFPAVTQPANTAYRLAVKPTTAGSITLVTYDVAAAAHLDQHLGGQAVSYSERTDGGSWSDITTRRLSASILVTKIHDGAGGGGGQIGMASA